MWNVYSSIRTLLWRRCTGICFKFLNYDHDGPVFIIGNTKTDAELVSGKYTSCVRLRVWDSLKSRIVLFDGDKNYLFASDTRLVVLIIRPQYDYSI